eukprot:2066341-Rhodomonas_salina.3
MSVPHSTEREACPTVSAAQRTGRRGAGRVGRGGEGPGFHAVMNANTCLAAPPPEHTRRQLRALHCTGTGTGSIGARAQAGKTAAAAAPAAAAPAAAAPAASSTSSTSKQHQHQHHQQQKRWHLPGLLVRLVAPQQLRPQLRRLVALFQVQDFRVRLCLRPALAILGGQPPRAPARPIRCVSPSPDIACRAQRQRQHSTQETLDARARSRPGQALPMLKRA